MIRSKILLLAAGLLMAGTGCQMMAKGPQLKAGMQRSAVGFGYATYTAEDAVGAETDVDRINVAVTHGWFLTQNAEVGGKLDYENSEVDSGGPTVETTNWVLAAFARWYFSGGSNLYPYVEALLGLGNSETGAVDDDFTRMSFGVGAMNFLTASAALDAIIKYQADSYDETDVDVDGIWVELAYSIFW